MTARERTLSRTLYGHPAARRSGVPVIAMPDDVSEGTIDSQIFQAPDHRIIGGQHLTPIADGDPGAVVVIDPLDRPLSSPDLHPFEVWWEFGVGEVWQQAKRGSSDGE